MPTHASPLLQFPKVLKMTCASLKRGFTTGAAAAAAAKGALYYLLSGKPVKEVSIRFLNGETGIVQLYKTEAASKNRVYCSVIKDAGDDPDVTHKAEIGVRIALQVSERNSGVQIIGGQGVGRVTKPGLELPVGSWAINSGPLQMIAASVKEVLSRFKVSEKFFVSVEVIVPKGEILAKKTLNSRLGIVGGISILGTTGIVMPMSHDAYVASIRSQISVAASLGADTLVFCTGRRSERYAMDLYPYLHVESFIQTGDFFKASLEELNAFSGITRIIYTVFFGKAVKMASGFAHTHAAKSELTMKLLTKWTWAVTKDKTVSQEVAESNTARHALGFIFPKYPQLIEYVGHKIIRSAKSFSCTPLDVESVIFGFNGDTIFNSQQGTRQNAAI